MSEELAGKRRHYDISLHGLLYQTIAEVARSTGTAEHTRRSEKVKYAVNYMNQYLAENIDLHAIARNLEYSYDHFRHFFKRETGYSPTQFLLPRRVDKAKRLRRPSGTVRMALDTDTYNEIDDQFALAYAMLSPDKVRLEAVCAAPFWNELSSSPRDGREKSCDEIVRILDRLGRSSDGFAFPGSDRYLPAANVPVDSPAARDLIDKALASSEDDPLYVVAIGAITNVASAILLNPDIIRSIVVVWLGGHHLGHKDTKEFNLAQDPHASRVLFDSGVPLALIPCPCIRRSRPRT